MRLNKALRIVKNMEREHNKLWILLDPHTNPDTADAINALDKPLRELSKIVESHAVLDPRATYCIWCGHVVLKPIYKPLYFPSSRINEELKPFHKECFQKNFQYHLSSLGRDPLWITNLCLYQGPHKFWYVAHLVPSDTWFVIRVQRQQPGYATITFPYEERILTAGSGEEAIERCKKEGMQQL